MQRADEVAARLAAYVCDTDAQRATIDDALACVHDVDQTATTASRCHCHGDSDDNDDDALRTALEEARARIADAQREVHDACRTVDDVARALSALAIVDGNNNNGNNNNSSSNNNVIAPVLASERATFADARVAHDVFARTLAALLRAVQPTVQGRARANDDDDETAAATQTTTTTTTTTSQPLPVTVPWHRDGALVLHVLSFLHAREVLTHAEDVCRAWRYWLSEPAVSRPFWLACVHREFAPQLQALLRSEDADALCAYDWRAVAMLCVCDEDDDDNTPS